MMVTTTGTTQTNAVAKDMVIVTSIQESVFARPAGMALIAHKRVKVMAQQIAA